MAVEHVPEYVTECFWPGVSDGDLHDLDARARACASEAGRDGKRVRYLGSLLMRDDEVVLCLFEGEPETVRQVAQEAAIPFERILEAAHSRWPLPESP